MLIGEFYYVVVKGTPYLRVAEAYRYTKDGGSIQRRKIIRYVGPLAKFDDGQPILPPVIKCSLQYFTIVE